MYKNQFLKSFTRKLDKHLKCIKIHFLKVLFVRRHIIKILIVFINLPYLVKSHNITFHQIRIVEPFKS